MIRPECSESVKSEHQVRCGCKGAKPGGCYDFQEEMGRVYLQLQIIIIIDRLRGLAVGGGAVRFAMMPSGNPWGKSARAFNAMRWR